MSDSESSDDEFGPAPAAPESEEKREAAAEPKRKKKRLAFEKMYVDNLPSVDQYERSFMHRDIVTHMAVSKNTEFVISASADGHVKFWKKVPPAFCVRACVHTCVRAFIRLLAFYPH